MRVLVVEDEVPLADALARGLRREGIAVDTATDGDMALEKVAITPYDVVVLDRDLPRVHGDAVCQTLRAGGSTARILMLTASGTIEDRVAGLNLGADDYLPKPFAFVELLARIRALGRRRPVAPDLVLERAGVRVDPARHDVSRGGAPIVLTPKELAVLEALLVADGAVVSPEALLDQVWDEHVDPFTNVVRVTIMTLRKKLGAPPLIETVVGAGYRIP
ncbi:MAG TPA: response regulator transcription factor [Acidimicrobiia bacterium]|jgi:DNA-binding response OmpR family regulator|nr:response regulator transcription factor [Acidimicrobiia bacterium]